MDGIAFARCAIYFEYTVYDMYTQIVEILDETHTNKTIIQGRISYEVQTQVTVMKDPATYL